MKIPFLSAVLATALSTMSLAADSAVQTAPLKTIEGKEASLKDHAGKVVLVVNVASECGYTSQYTGLEALYQKYKGQGLVVAGMPCNDFGGQEPGSEAEIQQFCSSNYKVTFPLYSKLAIKGEGKHPLYAALTGSDSPKPGDVKWNFEKFLIGRDGKIIARFGSGVEPDSAELVAAIEKALAEK